MWNSCEGAGTSLGLEEGGGGGRAHGGSAAGSLLRQSDTRMRARAGRWREDFLAVNGNGAAPNLAALTVKVSVSNGDNVRFKLLPGMAYADVQARLRGEHRGPGRRPEAEVPGRGRRVVRSEQGLGPLRSASRCVRAGGWFACRPPGDRSIDRGASRADLPDVANISPPRNRRLL